MPELRWTLLVLGALFIAGLAFWEYRRQRHARGQSVDSRAGEGGDDAPRVYREPTLNLSDVHIDGRGGIHSAAPSFEARRSEARERDPMAELPVVEIDDGQELTGLRVDRETAVDSFSMTTDDDRRHGPTGFTDHDVADDDADAQADADVDADLDADAHSDDEMRAPAAPMVPRLEPAEPMIADFRVGAGGEQIGDSVVDDFDEGVVGTARVVGDGPVPEFGETPTVSAAAEADAPAAPAAPFNVDTDAFAVQEPIVEWPEDDTRRIIALRLVSGGGDRFTGRAVRQALAAEGFLLGKFDIFHKPGPDARAVLSAASLTKPGSFSLATMDTQRFGGLSLFAVLPGPLSPTATFDELLTTARSLNDRLRGALQDERGEPLTSVRATALRDSLIAQTTAAAPVVGPPPVAGSVPEDDATPR